MSDRNARRNSVRPATTFAVLRASLNGWPAPKIAAHHHLADATVEHILTNAGHPDQDAVRDYLERFAVRQGVMWVVADEAAAFAAAIRVNPDWVHEAASRFGPRDLAAMVAVMAAMLPRDVNPRDALAWIASGADLEPVS